MEIKQLKSDVVLHCQGFSLADSLDCGQAFRWTNAGDFWRGVIGKTCVTVAQNSDTLIFKDSDIDTVNNMLNYFDLHADYDAIKATMVADSTIKKAIQYAGGIRILRQDSWETLISFIISQNNNIPRIKGIISRFCKMFGEKLSDDFYSFPTPRSLADITLDDLDPLRAGFRAKYILDAINKVVSGEVDLNSIKTMPIEDARITLQQIAGVGPKVAECVLLFGFYRLNAFPIDVWIKRCLERYYKDGFPEFAKKYGGVAQQYIFHYIRNLER